MFRRTLKIAVRVLLAISFNARLVGRWKNRTRVNAVSSANGSSNRVRQMRVQYAAPPVKPNQPASSSANVAGSTRLRRKLSTIFHLETTEMGFGTRLPDSSGTHSNNHVSVCQ